MNVARGEGNERLSCCCRPYAPPESVYPSVSFSYGECGGVSEVAEGRTAREMVRTVFLTNGLCRLLKAYARKRNIISGMIFVTRSGKPMDRSNIWREMKQISRKAGVNPDKVFPHNLRHLFARVYYSQEKDLVRLAEHTWTQQCQHNQNLYNGKRGEST